VLGYSGKTMKAEEVVAKVRAFARGYFFFFLVFRSPFLLSFSTADTLF
jgi:hypothetical protein